MNTVIDTLFLRRPKIDYLSPPVCEAIFSNSGSPVIILPDIAHTPGPTGLVIGGRGKFTLRWNAYPGALCYNVYSQINFDFSLACSDQHVIAAGAQYAILAECQQGTSIDLPQPGCYRITAITPDGESELSAAVCTCDCPNCVCPDGTTFYPDFNECLCSPQSCPSGQVWDPIICECVGCGSQHCPPSFFPDPLNPCNCVTGGGGPVQVCNQEQTATCPEGETGDPVTIPAGTFCTMAPNRLPDTIAAAQAAMNAEALAAAQDELVCTPNSGYKICQWPEKRDQITFSLCDPSVAPEWNGVFDKQSTWMQGPLWYFTGQSILGNSVAADEAPDYPGGDWQDNDCFAQLFFNAASHNWHLWIVCTNCPAPGYAWEGVLAQDDPNNAAGVYTNVAPGTGPDTMTVVPISGTCCADWNTLSWTAPSYSLGTGSTASATVANNGGHMQAFDPPGFSGAAIRDAVGSMHYTGPGCDCNLHVTINQWDGNGLSFMNIAILIRQDGVDMLSFIKNQVDIPPGTPGPIVFDTPFTINGGTNSLIEVLGAGALGTWLNATAGAGANVTINFDFSIAPQ